MSETWTHKYVAKRVTPGPAAEGVKNTRTTVTAGLHKLDGNDRPYFTVTCDIEEQARNNRWMEAGGGAAHERIVKLFPKLAPIVALHLADDNGVPMHAISNAVYHAGFSAYPDARNVEHLASHLRISRDDAQRLIDENEGYANAAAMIAEFVDAQCERWADEARAGIELLDLLITRQNWTLSNQ